MPRREEEALLPPQGAVFVFNAQHPAVPIQENDKKMIRVKPKMIRVKP
jgi:hypothetical protein